MAMRKTTTNSAPARKTAAKATIAKKAETKKTVKAKSVVIKTEPAETAPEKITSTPVVKGPAFKIKKSYLILVAVIIILGGLLYIYRSVFVAAVVNGQPISRLSVVQEAEKQSGKQVLTTLVRNTLIEQEARKQNVTVSDKEIGEEIKKLEGNLQKQGQKLEQVLTMQGMTKEDLLRLIRLDKMVGKMVGKDIKISDQQVKEYIEQNKESLPTDQNEKDLKATVSEQLKQQQLNEKVRTWLEALQKNAKINRFVSY
jgi:foldase protein PrsA